MTAASQEIKRWFVARTRYFRTEIKVRDSLHALGIECFVPTFFRRHPKGKGMVERTAAPNLIFARTHAEHANTLVTDCRLPFDWVHDSDTLEMVVVPDKQMEDFRRVFAVSSHLEGGLLEEPFETGAKVRVSDGPLQGVDGHIMEDGGHLYVVVGLPGPDKLFTRAKVRKAWLELQ